MPEENMGVPFKELILEALKGIKNEILLYGVVIAALLVGSAYLGTDVLREVKWPLIAIFTIALVFYFSARAVPQAKARILGKPGQEKGTVSGEVKITGSTVKAGEISGVSIKK